MSEEMRAVETAAEIALQAKQVLIDKIGQLPDNPRIRRTNHGFSITSSDLGHGLSPIHHDFRLQYRMIQEVVLKTPIEQVKRTLIRLVGSGTLPTPALSYDRGFTFHPDVIANLEALL